MKDYLPSFVADLNSTRVELDKLILAMRTVHELPTEKRDLEGRMLAIIHLFVGNTPQKYQAIYYRRVGLSKRLTSGDLPYFASPEGPDGLVLLQGAVGQAAASKPLLFSAPEVYSDSKCFQDRVLSLAEPGCHA